jgi:hypothetical protein
VSFEEIFFVSANSRRQRGGRTAEQLRQIRKQSEGHRRAEYERRRAEIHFREEHHDAHAKTIPAKSTLDKTTVTSSIVGGDTSDDTLPYAQAIKKGRRRIRVLIIKNLPAPLIDGFDVRGMCADQTYDVDIRTGHYLIIAGYAVHADEESVSN